jgi:hypothetical protein
LAQEETTLLETFILANIPEGLKGLVRDCILIALGRKEPDVPKLLAGNVWNKIIFFYESF